MLRQFSELRGLAIRASDGPIGSIRDVYFDDHSWTVRYLVADTGGWLNDRLVLLSPASAGTLDLNRGEIGFGLTRAQIENSPGIEAHQPVSRQHEMALAKYYSWPAYWSGPLQPIYDSPQFVLEHELGDPHLQSAGAVAHYHVQGADDDLGHVADFTFDDETWVIQGLVVDTGHWLPGRKIPVEMTRVLSINWDHSVVELDLTREQLHAPGDDPERYRRLPR